MDEDPYAVLGNGWNFTESRERFTELLENTMGDLVTAAADAGYGAKMFATKEASVKNITIYSLVQCTPDLSSSDCHKCLESALARLRSCCAGQQGANILYPSCNIRYETYPFYRINATGSVTPLLLPSPPTPQDSPTGSGGKRKFSPKIIIAVCASIAFVVLLFSVGCYWRSRGRAEDIKYIDIQYEQSAGNEITAVESLQFDLGKILAATNNFSADNKLGEGGFGAVYKGTLSNGQEIAVKRLARCSLQGATKFKNEVALVAKLQHRNLTRLLGFCLEKKEMILVYEFLPNKSLNNFLFDLPENQAPLDWSSRNKIIGGIARGLLYLHEDSRLRIIHRDLKSSNILLDQKMNPKISEFGTAKICGVDQTQGNTNKVVGTFGYMPPEYNTRLLDSESTDEFLLSCAWKHWRDGTPLELLDQRLRDHSYTQNEVIRCIHIGLLCVQEDPADRPTMASIVLMLNSYSVTLSSPKPPAFSPQHNRTENMPSVNEISSTEIYPR
ncbi:Serine/threonine protein kinase [Parasponia andersonii]|uniref:Serine/threonine protein kinase n=1 Tax=Parasponia andersonii TaxID=3476 RepID=A0A2P5AZU0_PARAD|nr:Serine/threonine protein kinase [Parasponia andersonii]